MASHIEVELTKSPKAKIKEASCVGGEVVDVVDIVDDTRGAANMARKAAFSCRLFLGESNSLVKMVHKRMNYATSRAKNSPILGMCRLRHVPITYYQNLAKNCRKATSIALKLSACVEKAAKDAVDSANDADLRANELSEVLDMQPETTSDRQQSATAAADNAKDNAITAYKQKYLLLRAVESCLRTAYNLGGRISMIDRDSSANRLVWYIVYGAVVVLPAFGFSQLYFALTDEKMRSTGYYSAFFLPTLFISYPFVIGILRLYQCICRKRREAAKTEKTKKLEKIQKECHDLMDYFKGINIPIPSFDDYIKSAESPEISEVED